MAEATALRAHIEAITQRQLQQCTTSSAAENTIFRRQLAFALEGSTSPESSQIDMILIIFLT